jgi:hypothetical protein
MTRTYSGKVFDRQVDGHPCTQRIGAELAAMARSAIPEPHAAGANIECDWRVSKQRELERCGIFDTCVPDRDHPQTLSGMLDVYFFDRVRGQTIPDFLRRHNINNLNRDQLPPQTEQTQARRAVQHLELVNRSSASFRLCCWFG